MVTMRMSLCNIVHAWYLIVICQEKPVEGPCHEILLKWYYNPKLRRCEKFWYSGCGGSYNRFTSQFECLKEKRRDKSR
uniref:BPTI/Kunitz inhibitor domain-containing protein n=1 Tax=Eptatretus burgeri TaxID=7764 RepID=A0A8C4QQV9_EPTBU